MTCYVFQKTAETLLYIHTQGYITLNKYIIAIASIGLPKVNLWATKCVTKRPQNAAKTLFVQSKNSPQKINILNG